MAIVMKHMASNFSKLDKFKGVNFRKWHNKMHFLISSMSVVMCLLLLFLKMGRMLPWNKSGRGISGKMMTMFAENCGKPEHLKKDCKGGRVGNKANGLGTNGSVDGSTNSLRGLLHVDLLRTESRVLGTIIRLPDPKLKTLGKRGIEFIFVGYAEHFKAFRFYVIEPNESVSINSIIKSRDVIFDENRFSSVPRPSLRISNGTEDIGCLVVPEEVTEEISGQHSYCFNVEDNPKKFDEVIKSQDVAFWKEAINDKMESIMGNKTWVLVDLPPGCKPLGYKWIFKRKLKVDGTIEKFKARLVIQGFRQKSRIDYFDTYALVTRISTIRLMIALALIHNLIIHKMDVKTTFLNDELDKEVYMNQPLVFIMPGNENKVDLTNEFLSSKFSMKDMGEADFILGVRIKHESNGIAISQSHYIKVIGCMMYDMAYTRLGIAFAVGKLSRYTSIPEGYTDASWISNTEDNSSTSSYVFLHSRAAGKEAEWLRNMILEIPLWSKPIAPISIRYNSAATLAKAYSQMYNGKSRHLGVRHSMIRELIINGVVSIEFIRS
ncbi:zinc finger, CCHC-type containing protein [Tanacetum coccineum]